MVGSALEDEIGDWVSGNEGDISLESLDFFNFPSVSLEGDDLDGEDWAAKLQGIGLYTSEGLVDTSDGDILNAALKPKQEPPLEFVEEAPRTRISAQNDYSDGSSSRHNQAPSPDSVLNSNHSGLGEKGISTSSEDLKHPQPNSSQLHDSSAPRRSKRVASKPIYRSFNYPDFYIPDTVACLSEEQPQKKKKRKLSKVLDSGKVPLCSSQHTSPHGKCSYCGATETIEWREGPLGPKILCNSCGVQYRYGRLFPEYHPAARPTFDSSQQTMFCMKGGNEKNKAVRESYLSWDDELPEFETESKMSLPSDDFEFYPLGIKEEETGKRKVKKKVKLTMQTSSPGNQRCLHCDVGTTTQWREGPMGPRTLCNACGIRYRSGRLFPEYRPADSPTFVPSLHSYYHRKVIELRKKAIQEASGALKEPMLSRPKVVEETVITDALLMSAAKDMKEEAIIATEIPSSPPKDMKEATIADMDLPFQPPIEETIITDSEPLMSPLHNMKEAASADIEPLMPAPKDTEGAATFDVRPQMLVLKAVKEATIADTEPLLSLPNGTKAVRAELADPLSPLCKDIKETPFIGIIKPPWLPCKDPVEAANANIELPLSPLKDMKEVDIIMKPLMSSSYATEGVVVADRETLVWPKAIQEAVIAEAGPMTLTTRSMEQVIVADAKSILSSPKVTEKAAVAEIKYSSPRYGRSEFSFLNGENLVRRIRTKDKEKKVKEKKDQNKGKKKLPKLPGINQNSSERPTTTRKCLHCQITKTPLWREGPLGRQTLCNACGLRYASGRLFPEYRPAASPTFVPTLHSNSHKKVVELRGEGSDEEAMADMEPSTRYSMVFNSSNG